MAILRSIRDEKITEISSRLLVGRSEHCGLKIDIPHVSAEHARITWNGSVWQLKDLGSKNGTFLDGVKIEPGRPSALEAGHTVAFGHPEHAFYVASDAPPGLFAVKLGGEGSVSGEHGLLVLPSEDEPTLSVFHAKSGGWIVEPVDGEPRRVRDQEVLRVGDDSWRISLPTLDEGTPLLDVSLSLDTVALRFLVSRDEETVVLKIVGRGMELELEAREHWYVLLTLARARQLDEAQPLDDRGWRSREDLVRMLRMDPNALNVAIHRARQSLLAAGVEGAEGIVEVRRGRRRLGPTEFSIEMLEA